MYLIRIALVSSVMFIQRITLSFLSSTPPCVQFLSALVKDSSFPRPWIRRPSRSTRQVARNKFRQCASKATLRSPSGDSTVRTKSNTTTTTTSSGSASSFPPSYRTFEWRNHRIKFVVVGPEDGQPVLLTHGFGANSRHWRKNIPILNETARLRIYAIDLLGFGASDKPNLGRGNYSLELWRDLVVDFILTMDNAQQWALVGNSMGSLISLMAVTKLGQERVRSLAMLNCAGGLTSFRYSELNPILAGVVWCVNLALFNRFTGPSFFNRFRTRENIRSILLQQVYVNKDAVDEELVDILHTPALDENAAKVFLAIVTGPPGPCPEELLPQVPWCPILVLWGEKDRWTPFDRGMHPGCNFNQYHPQLEVVALPNTAHCPHDDNPEGVHKHLVPFLIEPSLGRDKQELN